MNTTDKLPTGTQIGCVAHDGAHTGKIVRDLGFAYAVHWHGYVDPVTVDSELAEAHRFDFTYIDYDKVTKA